MAIVLLNLYQAETGAWYALLQNDTTGQTAELKYRAKPTQAQARADVLAVFNPPTVRVTAEDGSALDLVGQQPISLSLTAGQKTAIANAESTIQQWVDTFAGKLSQFAADDLMVLRAKAPLLDALLRIIERVR